MQQLVTFTVLTLYSVGALGAEPTAADVLAKVSARYRNMQTFQLEGGVRAVFSRGGQIGMTESRTLLAVGREGAFRVERSENGTPQLRVSDGKITWKALPNQKVWSKQEAAQQVGSDDADETPAGFQAQDLFAQSLRAFVSRYTGLEKYAAGAVMDKGERVKFNGSKVECYVVTLSTPGVANRLYIARDSFLVLRHTEKTIGAAIASTDLTTELKTVSEGTPSADFFEFQPGNSREVADVLLPAERQVSLVGARAADFTLKALTGEPVHLADLQGKIVMLDFWATWCQPCRHELPTVEALSRKYKERNVVVLGINDEDVSTAKHFLEKFHPDLATLHDAGKKVKAIYGCDAIPTVVIINPQGTIVAHFVGTRSEDVLVAALKQAGLK